MTIISMQRYMCIIKHAVMKLIDIRVFFLSFGTNRNVWTTKIEKTPVIIAK